MRQAREHQPVLHAELEQLERQQGSTDPIIPGPDGGPTRPWRAIDRIQVALYCIAMLLLFSLGCALIYNTLEATNPKLIESTPYLIVGYFSIPLIFPFAVEILDSFFTSDRGKRRYLAFIAVMAGFGSVLWLVQFSIGSENALRGTIDMLSDLWDKKGKQSSGTSLTATVKSYLDKMALAIQILTEGLLMALLWRRVLRIAVEHQKQVAIDNPVYVKLGQAISDKRIEIEALRDHVGHLEIDIRSLDRLKEAFKDNARTMLEEATIVTGRPRTAS